MTNTKDAQNSWLDWVGADVHDETGDKLGKLENIYMDRGTGEPEWLAITTGFFGRNETFIPIGGVDADGDALRVPYRKDFVKDAPNVDPDHGFISDEQEADLYRYYGRNDYKPWSDDEVDVTAAGRTTGTTTGKGKGRGKGKDDAMTRSEEELDVSTREREAARVRLHKYVVTENVTKTVPVRKEKVRVEREPITDANRDDALDGPDITEADHEIVLNEEEVVTDKRVVPKERVRLDKDVDITDEKVSGEVRKEQIDVER